MLRVNAFNLLKIFGFLAFALVLGCTSAEKSPETPEAAFQAAQEFDKEERFEEAIRRYTEVRTKYPYSKFAKMSELAIADVYYKQESFAEAQVSYQSFKEMNPKHPQIDYITFRIAMSYFRQLPSSIDRDLSIAPNAILYFDEVLSSYPNSNHVTEASEKKSEALRMMAEKELYIANFYAKKINFISALGRYEDLLKKFPGSKYEAEALSGAAISAQKIGELEKAKSYLSELAKRFPDSTAYIKAKKEVN